MAQNERQYTGKMNNGNDLQKNLQKQEIEQQKLH
jgi:hypothetical protein